MDDKIWFVEIQKLRRDNAKLKREIQRLKTEVNRVPGLKRQVTQPNDTIAAMNNQLYLARRHRYTDSRYERSTGASRH
jgi:hypothetical protein